MDGFLGLSEEAAYGEATTTIGRFYEFVDEALAFQPVFVESKGIRDGSRYDRTGRWNLGTGIVAGRVNLELQTAGFGVFFKHMLGAIATTGGAPFVHTATPGSLKGKSLRVQVARSDLSATKRPFAYTGLKVKGWTIESKIDDYAHLGLDLLGRQERTADTLATPNYAAAGSGSGSPVLFTAAALTLGGTSTPVKAITLTGQNGFADKDRLVLGSQLMNEPQEFAQRNITGTIDADFTDLTAYTRFTAGTEAALSLVFASVLTVTLTVRTEGDTPHIGGMQEVRQPLKIKALADTAGTGQISFAYSTTDATP